MAEWIKTTKYVNERKRPPQFVRDLLFRREEVSLLADVSLTLQMNVLEMAPFTRLGGPAVLVGGEWDEEVRFTPPNIRLKKALDTRVLYGGPPVGQSHIVDEASLRKQIAYKREREMAKLPDIVETAIEWMCCKALSGSISYQIKGSVSTFLGGARQDNLANFEVAFGTSSEIVLSGDLRWNVTPSGGTYGSGADPAADFRTVKRTIAAASGMGVTDCIMGKDAANALLKNPNIKELLRKDSGIATGALTLLNAFSEFGVNFLGEIAGIRIWEYNQTVVMWNPAQATSNAALIAGRVTSTFFDDSKVYFFSTAAAAQMAVYYGTVHDLPQMQGRELATKRFAKRWTEEDPAVENMLVTTRPLPILEKPKAVVVLDPMA